MQWVKGITASIVVLAGLLTTTLTIAVIAFVRLKDVEADIKHHREVIYDLVYNIHITLLKDKAYRHFDKERRIAELKSILDFILPRCINYAPADRRVDMLQHAENILPEIAEKE